MTSKTDASPHPPSIPPTMAAVVYTRHGEPSDVLSLAAAVPTPTLPPPPSGLSTPPAPVVAHVDTPPTLLLRVAAVALNPVDGKRCRRTAALPFPRWPAAPDIPAFDVAGQVVASTDADPALGVGAWVAGMVPAGGALAEYVAVPGRCVAPIPPGVSAVTAAAVPLAGLTALQVLRRLGVVFPQGEVGGKGGAGGGGIGSGGSGDSCGGGGGVGEADGDGHGDTPGDGVPPPASMLLHGGVGGVGSFAVQLAARVGRVPRVVVSVSAAKAGLATRLGATHTVPAGAAAAVAAAVTASPPPGDAVGVGGGGPVDAAADFVGDGVPGLFGALDGGGGGGGGNGGRRSARRPITRRRPRQVCILGPSSAASAAHWFPRGSPPPGMGPYLAVRAAPTTLRAWAAGVDWAPHVVASDGAAVGRLLRWVAAGAVEVVLAAVVDGLAAWREALAVVEGGHAAGKVVIRVWGGDEGTGGGA